MSSDKQKREHGILFSLSEALKEYVLKDLKKLIKLKKGEVREKQLYAALYSAVFSVYNKIDFPLKEKLFIGPDVASVMYLQGGTGTGKTIIYLVGALYTVKARNEEITKKIVGAIVDEFEKIHAQSRRRTFSYYEMDISPGNEENDMLDFKLKHDKKFDRKFFESVIEKHVKKSLENNNSIIVSTATKVLQDQVLKHDLPSVLKALGLENEVEIVHLVGLSNYLCREKIESAFEHDPSYYEAFGETATYAADIVLNEEELIGRKIMTLDDLTVAVNKYATVHKISQQRQKDIITFFRNNFSPSITYTYTLQPGNSSQNETLTESANNESGTGEIAAVISRAATPKKVRSDFPLCATQNCLAKDCVFMEQIETLKKAFTKKKNVIIVTNHHNLIRNFSKLNHKWTKGHKQMILDEAHLFEKTVHDSFSHELDLEELKETLAFIHTANEAAAKIADFTTNIIRPEQNQKFLEFCKELTSIARTSSFGRAQQNVHPLFRDLIEEDPVFEDRLKKVFEKYIPFAKHEKEVLKFITEGFLSKYRLLNFVHALNQLKSYNHGKDPENESPNSKLQESLYEMLKKCSYTSRKLCNVVIEHMLEMISRLEGELEVVSQSAEENSLNILSKQLTIQDKIYDSITRTTLPDESKEIDRNDEKALSTIRAACFNPPKIKDLLDNLSFLSYMPYTNFSDEAKKEFIKFMPSNYLDIHHKEYVIKKFMLMLNYFVTKYSSARQEVFVHFESGERNKLTILPSLPKFAIQENLEGYGKITRQYVSATLIPQQEDFNFFARIMGEPDHIVFCMNIKSEYDYEKNTLCYIPKDLPDPKREYKSWHEKSKERILELCKHSRGGTLVLFTNNDQMRKCYFQLRKEVEESGMIPVMQGMVPSQKLSELMYNSPNTVIFGSRLLAQGFDVQGLNLRQVIIPRLPFERPDDVLSQAQRFYVIYNEMKLKSGTVKPEQLKKRKEEIQKLEIRVFHSYDLPRTILLFKQMVGRLVRSKKDMGGIAVLDRRVYTAKYGKKFLEALPEGMSVTSELEKYKQFIDKITQKVNFKNAPPQVHQTNPLQTETPSDDGNAEEKEENEASTDETLNVAGLNELLYDEKISETLEL